MKKITIKILIGLYLLTLGIMSLLRFFTFLNMKMFDRDRYIYHINQFENQSFYDQIAYGTSTVFNAFIYVIDYFCKNLDTSFKILNVVSVIGLGTIGGVIIYKNKGKQKWITLLFLPVFMFLWLNDEQLHWTNNDIFLSVIVLLLYLVIFTVDIITNKIAIVLGLLFGIMYATRFEFSLVLLPAFIYCFIVLYLNKKIDIKKLMYVFMSFVITLSLINYPSINEHHKLSTYVKGGDYGSYNTVGTLRMFDENKVQLIRKEIYVESSSSEIVNEYQQKHQIEELPNNVFKFMVAYPWYYLKLYGLNIVNVFVFLFRRYALFVIFPFLFLYKKIKEQGVKSFYSLDQVPFLMFLISSFFLLFVLHTVIEFRWLDTIEFLIIFAIFRAIKYLYNISYKLKWLDRITVASLMLLSVFNLRTIINIFY